MNKKYSLFEIQEKLNRNSLPFRGITEFGSAFISFKNPAFYGGLAIHAGNIVRSELLDSMEVSVDDRYREEDPFTELFIEEIPIQIIGRDSRFEYDVNRERERAIYETVKQSWGIKVWKNHLTHWDKKISLKKYDEFHRLIDIVTNYMLQHNTRIVLFDCHSYNYQREERLPWYESEKPDINIGTAAVNRSIFGNVIDDFIYRLSEIRIDGHALSVKENDIFKGGYFSRKLCRMYPDRILVLAIEFKKIFMDEWTGELYQDRLRALVSQFEAVWKELIEHSIFQ